VQGKGAKTLTESNEHKDLEVTQRGPDVEFTGYQITKRTSRKAEG
jgi:hypothetical protein